MICPVPTGNSGSNWLDRLRSNKGFPTGDNLDLDHCLKSNPNPELNSSESTQSKNGEFKNRKAAEDASKGNGDDKDEWFGLMSNVLSDLFNMGEPDRNYRFSRKKSARKQANPKFCVVSTPVVSSNTEEQQSSGCVVRKDGNAPAENVNVSCDNIGEEEDDRNKCEKELFGYSRNEVTVIDTSCTEWKFDKLVYRKGSVWKVREKKGKSRNIGRKKRKAKGCEENVDRKKKVKAFSSELNQKDYLSPLEHKQSHRDEKRHGVVANDISDDLTQVPKKRLSLSRLSKKTKKGGSSSIMLIKGKPIGNKKGSKIGKRSTLESGTEKRQALDSPREKGFGIEVSLQEPLDSSFGKHLEETIAVAWSIWYSRN